MEHHINVDKSLTERHGILLLLEKLNDDGITVSDLEEIGAKLRTSGRRALSPLVRKLWREKKADLIAKYAYLLDFFDDDSWIDQLIQIALKRRDLEDDGKAALFAALEGYGVDVTVPPLATCLSPRDGGSLRTNLPRLLDKGDEGLVRFMEDFFFESQENRLAIIRELPRLAPPRTLPLVDTLLAIEDPEILVETLTALGKIRHTGAAWMVQTMLHHADDAVREAAVRSFRRLSFIGIKPEAPFPPAPFLPFHSAYASPFDSAGVRAVWISRKTGERVTALYLQLCDAEGIRAAWGCGEITVEEFSRYLAETSSDDGIVDIPPHYALSLVQDALFRSRENGILLPAEFYVWRRMFTSEELAPLPYQPVFSGFDLEALARSARHIAATGTLLDDDFFTGWLLADDDVYDLAEQWNDYGEVRRQPAQTQRCHTGTILPEIADSGG